MLLSLVSQALQFVSSVFMPFNGRPIFTYFLFGIFFFFVFPLSLSHSLFFFGNFIFTRHCGPIHKTEFTTKRWENCFHCLLCVVVFFSSLLKIKKKRADTMNRLHCLVFFFCVCVLMGGRVYGHVFFVVVVAS